VLFDNPRHHGYIILNDAEKDERRRSGNQAMIDWAFSIVARYPEKVSGPNGTSPGANPLR